MTNTPSAPDNGKILVVDDNPIIQRAVFFQLRDKGYKVIMCGDLSEAMGLARREKPDVIILDINFPAESGTVRDGFFATKFIHQNDEMSDIPVILISSADPAEASPKALEAGAAAYMAKPLDKDRLLAMVQKLIAMKNSAPPSKTEGGGGLKMA